MQDLTDFDIAGILSDSLKYIRLYSGQTVVVKYGGNAMKDARLQREVMHDLVLLSKTGVRIVLVHGGGPAIKASLDALGVVTRFENGLRVTDEETMKVVQRVLAGEVNKDLVKLLCAEGARAVGLCGLDASMLQACPKSASLGRVGEITHVDVTLVSALLDQGCIPVIASVAGDSQGGSYNVNADTVAAVVAGALKAKRLILMTDINGVMRDIDDPSSLLAEITIEDVHALMCEGVISGGMIPKVECALSAIEAGVERVVMLNGTLPHAVLVEMLTQGGIGTLIKPVDQQK